MLIKMLVVTILVMLLLSAADVRASSSYVTVYYGENGALETKAGLHEHQWVAQGNFTDQYFKTGWNFLEIRTNHRCPDSQQAYAAGLAEAFLTRHLIIMHWNNTVSGYCQWQSARMCARLKQYVSTNTKWVRNMVQQRRCNHSYWHQVGLVLEQLDGLIKGVNLHPTIPGDPGIFWMNLAGDLEDLQSALADPEMSRPTGRTVFGSRVMGGGHCSALIKLLANYSDLYTSQVTWNSYQSMLRIQKRYVFGYHMTSSSQSQAPDTSRSLIPGYISTFSSYPGIISSQDDFYMLSSGLVAQETTIGNSNNKLWRHIKPLGTVMEWVRAVVANNLATSGRHWTRVFSRYNSGTYNNQWMLVDYSRFKSGRRPLPQSGLLTVLEQIPGLIVSEDVTHVLAKQKYWPSYNSPYFSTVFNMSGIPTLVARYGDWFSYERSPRARIFRRDQGRVDSVSSMVRLMRYNDFRHDPLSACNCTPPYSGENAVSARCDLNPADGRYPFEALGHRDHGATDMKLTTDQLMRDMRMVTIAGPTYDPLPPFQWSKSDFGASTRHQGHPDLFKFQPITWQWQWR